MKYYAKKDILIVETFIKAGDEILIVKVGKEKVMICCAENNLYKWIDLDDYNDTIEEKD